MKNKGFKNILKKIVKMKRKSLMTLASAGVLGLCLLPLIITGIRRNQAHSINLNAFPLSNATTKPLLIKTSEPWGDINDLRDYINIAKSNAFIEVFYAGKEKQLFQEGTQEDIDKIADEALFYIGRTLSSFGLNKITRPKVNFVNRFLGIYPVTMRNIFSGRYIGGMYNPINHQIEISAVDHYTLRDSKGKAKSLLVGVLKEYVTHELVHSQYPGLPFSFWHKIPLFADESFVTVATLETIADQALQGDRIAKYSLLTKLVSAGKRLTASQNNEILSGGDRDYNLIPMEILRSALNGHINNYKGVSLDSLVGLLNQEIEEVDDKYHDYLTIRNLEDYCLSSYAKVECLGPIKQMTLIPDTSDSDRVSKIDLYYQINNLTGLYQGFINQNYYNFGVADFLPVELVAEIPSDQKDSSPSLLVLHDVFGKIITIQMPEKQGQYLIRKTKSLIKETIPYKGNFYETLKSIRD